MSTLPEMILGTSVSLARAPRGFAALSPLAKLAIWIGAVATLATGVQGVAWALGLQFNILLESGGGRGVLLGLTLGCLLVVMAADGRPLADYGLAIARSWQKVLLGGFLIGAVVYSSLYALLVIPQVGLPQTDSLTVYRCVRTGLSAMTAFPVAMTQQIIFGGYLLSILRQRYGRVTAVLVPAALFALLRRMDNPAMLIAPNGYPLIVGLFLVVTLLGVLRLKTGGILLPAGVLAGCIFMRRILRKTWLIAVTDPSGNVNWTVPEIDPVQSPLVWGLLIATIVLCWFCLKDQTAGQVAAAPKGIDTSFKKVFPLSNTSMLAPLDVWLARLADARFRVGLKYVPRLIAILLVSSVNTVLSLPERLLAPLVVRWHRVKGPVFIVGVHRSGTTHLHNMLALDPQFCTPRTHQILNPAGFFTGSWVIAPLLGAFLPWKRPMDAVRFHIFTPQEDEYVLQGLGRLSPYWAMTFPRRGAHYDRYILPEGFSESELRTWKRHLSLFLGKLTFWSRRRPLLKNPYNTGRAAVLGEMFPKARFIHISRHPYDVYRSNMHMAREGHVVNQLQDPDETDSYQTRFLDNYRAMETAYYRATRRMSRDRVVDVRFEDLERDPTGQIRRIYAQLGLEFSPRFQQRLQRYLEDVAGYQKNRFHTLPEAQQHRIDAKMGSFMLRWGYSPAVPDHPAERREAA